MRTITIGFEGTLINKFLYRFQRDFVR